MKNRKKPYIIIGSGGHAKVIVDLLECNSENIHGVLNLDGKGKQFYRYPILGDNNYLKTLKAKQYNVAIGIGFTSKNMKTRHAIFNLVNELGFDLPTLIHPTAIVSKFSKLNKGCQLLAGSIIGVETTIGDNCIINTGAKIDHDTSIGDHCHIAPGSVICGSVMINEKCFIGAGSTIIENVSISKNTILGAGSVVVKDIKKSGIYFGNPAKKK